MPGTLGAAKMNKTGSLKNPRDQILLYQESGTVDIFSFFSLFSIFFLLQLRYFS